MNHSSLNNVLICCLLISIVIFPGFSQPVKLYINEFQASNNSSVMNPITAEYADWIEIYNGGDTGVVLDGCYLTDDAGTPDKWQILISHTLFPGEFIVFWADGYDNFLRTNFKLRQSKGFIGLYAHDGQVIDSLSYGFQEDDVSYGRLPNDINSWAFFDQVTPGSPNPDLYMIGKTPDPVFSIQGGFYKGSQMISVYPESPNIKVYYTLNGETPGKSDSIFDSPIQIDSTTALRIRAYKSGMLPGNIVTQTYFINETVNLPFISLTTDPDNLFDDSIGIYVIGTNGIPGYCSDIPQNLNQHWERPANVELYDTSGTMEINQMAGLQIYGGCSRTRYPQKSLALYARYNYGKPSFECQIFKDKPIYSFQSFILRVSGDDVVNTLFKDAMGQALMKDMETDNQGYRPAVVFINGKYWGIHNIREKINEHYVAENYNLDTDDINILQGDPRHNSNVICGTSEGYNSIIQYVSTHDMKAEGVYEYLDDQIDMNNYIDYQIAEIFLAANDWPMNNIKFWSANVPPYNKWRWIIFDLDNCFFYDAGNTLALATDPDCRCTWPNPSWSTLLFRKLLENETYRNEFIQRYAWHMNTTFQPSRVIHVIDSMKENIAAEIPRHIKRWGGQMVPFPESWIRPTFNSMEEWLTNVDRMKWFARARPEPARQHVADYFGLPRSMMRLGIHSDQPEAGIIKLNRQVMHGKDHVGEYFKDIPMTIKAIPALGYRFSHWDYSLFGKAVTINQSPVLDIIPSEDLTLTAHFVKMTEDDLPLVINEINYHSPGNPNTGDWIEIFNRKDAIVDLSGWYLKDGEDSHTFNFPYGLEIGPNGYLVLCEDLLAFEEILPDVKNRIGDLGFGLSNAGEVIRLYASTGDLIDSVRYDDDDPWPNEPDGNGPTLELISPDLDNDLPESWVESYRYGTPGAQNFSNTIEKNILKQNYPNPFNGDTNIPYSIKTPGVVTIRLFDIFGKEMVTLLNERKEISSYVLSWNSAGLSNGVYIYTLTVDNKFVDARKMVVTR